MRTKKIVCLLSTVLAMTIAFAMLFETPAYAMWGGDDGSTDIGNGAAPAPETITPQVTGIVLNPTSATVYAGGSQHFDGYALVNTSGADTSVTWSVQGSNGSSSVDGAGNLNIGANETATALTVGIKSNLNPAVSTSAQVSVLRKNTVNITTGSLPNGQIQVGYQAQIQATGDGVGLSLASGSLPSGLSMQGNGVISGTPTQAGSFGFTVNGRDQYGNNVQKGYTIVIGGKTVCSDPKVSLASGKYNSAQTVTLASPDGAAIYYQMDGNNPNPGTLYTGPVTIASTCYFKAVCRKKGMNDSNVVTMQYYISGPAFVPVKDIQNVAASAQAGVPVNLSGTVVPASATNKKIVWTLTKQGTTKAVLSGTTFLAAAGGTAQVVATVINGSGTKVNYYKVFTIAVTPAASNTTADTGNTGNTGKNANGTSGSGNSSNQSAKKTTGKVYTLTVTGGTGSGKFTSGTAVAIEAGAAPDREMFRGWTTDGNGTFADAGMQNTSFVMPASDATVTAVYDDYPSTAVFTADNNTTEVKKGTKLVFTLKNNYGDDTVNISPAAIVVNGVDKKVKNTQIASGKTKSYAIKFGKSGYYDIAMKYTTNISGAPGSIITDVVTIVVNDGTAAPSAPTYSDTAEYVVESDARYPYGYTYFPCKSASKKSSSSGMIKIDNAWHDQASVLMDGKSIGQITVADNDGKQLYQNLTAYEKGSDGGRYICLWVNYDGDISVNLSSGLSDSLKALGLAGIKENNTYFTWKDFE